MAQEITQEELKQLKKEYGITNKEIEAVKTLLKFMGDDPEREGLIRTPIRHLKALKKEWCKGNFEDPRKYMQVTFNDGADGYTGMVLVKDITVFSRCEHHLAPFYGKAHVAYIPDKGIVGLSKINRLVDSISRRLQVQERITTEILKVMEEELKPLGVAVVLNCIHTCCNSRGIGDTNSSTVTQAFSGAFFNEAKLRNEFMLAIQS